MLCNPKNPLCKACLLWLLGIFVCCLHPPVFANPLTRDLSSANDEKRGTDDPAWDYLRRTVTLHGGVVAHYQHYANAEVTHEGKEEHFTACISPQLEMTWKPIEQGHVYARIRYTKNRVDLSQEGIVLANLLETNVSHESNGRIRLQKLYYTHRLMNDRVFAAVGKTDGETYLDTNAFANDSRTQFMGQPLVNNPVLDDQDDFAPFIALGARPRKDLQLFIMGQSSSWAMGEHQKDIWEDMTDRPFIAAQATFSPELNGHKGHYRLYGWLQSCDHPVLRGAGYEKGWGIGLGLDQEVSQDVGLFARLGHQNDHVYEVPWFWSAGVSVTGLLPRREEDTFGLGISGLKANPATPHEGTEIHVEAYYRIRLSSHFFISPDFQYVLNPLGNDDETAVFASMLRGAFRF